MTVFQCSTHTAQEPGSLFLCHAVMSLQFTHVCSFACRGRADCSTVSSYCITITWLQIFKGLLQATIGILLHVTVERRHLGR